jgi:hypothetical protein
LVLGKDFDSYFPREKGLKKVVFLRRRVIYTYHEECPNLAEVYDGESLLEMWSRDLAGGAVAAGIPDKDRR